MVKNDDFQNSYCAFTFISWYSKEIERTPMRSQGWRLKPQRWMIFSPPGSLLSRFSRVRLCATPQTAAHQAPLSQGFSWQEHWSGSHFLLQCMKVKSESKVAQSCPTLSYSMDCSLPGSSVHGIFQASVLAWGTIAFSDWQFKFPFISPQFASLLQILLLGVWEKSSFPKRIFSEKVFFKLLALKFIRM